MSVLVSNESSIGGVNAAKPLDLSKNGQNGMNLQLGVWDHNTHYVRQNTLTFLLTAPVLMKYMPNFKDRLGALKSTLETRPRALGGLAGTLDLEYSAKDIGSAGEQQHTVVGGKIAVSAPSFTIPDFTNAAVSKNIEELIRFVYYDPDLGGAGVARNKDYLADAQRPEITPVNQVMYLCFVEPDASMTKVVRCWLCACQPVGTGDIVGGMTKGAALESPDITLTMNATTHRYAAARIIGENLLTELMSRDFQSESGETFNGIEGVSAEVASLSDNGVLQTLNSDS